MRISDFNFELPDDLIARYPPESRRDSRLLFLDAARQSITDRQFTDLPSLLRTGDLLVLNDTRVIPARLIGHKDSGGKVEVLVERILSDNSGLALIRASKSPKPGTRIDLPDGVRATVTGREDDLFTLEFSTALLSYLEESGEVPLPPYLGREAEETDRERYQCVYADKPGAIAAPTAGLHFDTQMLQQLAALGIQHCYVTLHVGAGTFQSLRCAHVEANKLHKERVQVSDDVCDAVVETHARGGRVVAVGTTSVRALETSSAAGELRPFTGETDLFIYPGYHFRCVDALLTNFHLPESSLLMLVSAFAGKEFVLRAYEHAVHARYRFFSYGDAMLIANNHEA
jgi:S-adenosylmethionine:tRNA ribosyltransferase-isomerase